MNAALRAKGLSLIAACLVVTACAGESAAPSGPDDGGTSGGPDAASPPIGGSGGQGHDATAGRGGSSIGLLVLQPAEQSFGEVSVGSQSALKGFRVSNGAGVAVGPFAVGIAGTHANDFLMVANGCAAALAPDRNCDVTVAFAPQAAGAREAVLRVDDGHGPLMEARLTGLALPEAQLVVEPSTWSVGTVFVGQTSSKVFTVRNVGNTASGTIMLNFLDGKGDFTAINNCQKPLRPADTCSVTVRYSPITAGPLMSTMTVSASPGGSAQVALTAVGARAPRLAITPSSHDFGVLPNRQQGTPTTFTITGSEGSADAQTGPLQLSLPAGFSKSSDTCTGSRLGPGATTCTVVVWPSGTASEGAHTLRVSASPGGEARATMSLARPAPDALVAYWSFDNDLQDSSGNGNHGTFMKGRTDFTARSQSAAFETGRKGRAVRFFNPPLDDGAFETEWVKVPSSDSINAIGQMQAFSITMWVKANDYDVTGDDFNFAISRQESGTNYEHFGLGLLTGRPTVGVHFFFASSPEALPRDGQFHHIAATYNGLDMVVFVDGRASTSSSIGWPISSDTTPVLIGANQNVTHIFESFVGAIDEVRLYSTPLTAAQIKADMDR